jgi:hypothetical protein
MIIISNVGFAIIGLILPLFMISVSIFIIMNDLETTLFLKYIHGLELFMQRWNRYRLPVRYRSGFQTGRSGPVWPVPVPVVKNPDRFYLCIYAWKCWIDSRCMATTNIWRSCKKLHKYFTFAMAISGTILSYAHYFGFAGFIQRIMQFITTEVSSGIMLLVYLDTILRRQSGTGETNGSSIP